MSVVISFRATPELAEWLATLGAATDNTRANTCFTILTAAMYGQTADMVKIMERRP